MVVELCGLPLWLRKNARHNAATGRFRSIFKDHRTGSKAGIFIFKEESKSVDQVLAASWCCISLRGCKAPMPPTAVQTSMTLYRSGGGLKAKVRLVQRKSIYHTACGVIYELIYCLPDLWTFCAFNLVHLYRAGLYLATVIDRLI